MQREHRKLEDDSVSPATVFASARRLVIPTFVLTRRPGGIRFTSRLLPYHKPSLSYLAQISVKCSIVYPSKRSYIISNTGHIFRLYFSRTNEITGPSWVRPWSVTL